MADVTFEDNPAASGLTGIVPGMQAGVDVKFDVEDLVAGASDLTTATGELPMAQVAGLVAALGGKAADSNTVHKTGAETIAGVKTFSSAPDVPANSWAIADTSGLQTALDAKATDSGLVHTTGAESISGIKTFASSPIVPAPTTAFQAATKGYVDGLSTTAVLVPTGGDDTAQIAAAALTDRGVVLGPGEFIASVVALRSGLRIQGCGQGITTLKLKNATNDILLKYAIGGLTNVHISDLTIDGNKANQTGSSAAIGFVVMSKSSLRRVTVKNSRGIGIQIYQGSDITVEDCDFTDCGSSNTIDGTNTAIWATQVTDLRVVGNKISGCSDTGIVASVCIDPVITDNIIKTCFFIGIALGAGAGTGAVIADNSISTCAGNGIDTGTATRFAVTGNNIVDCYDGIDIDMSTLGATVAGGTIVGNTIHSSARYGIILVAGASFATVFTVADNTVTDSQLHGIGLDNIHSATVTGNVVRNASRAGAGYAGIAISDGLDNIISGNRCLEVGTALMLGIDRSTGTNNYNIWTSNNTRSCASAIVGSAGANDVTADNIA